MLTLRSHKRVRFVEDISGSTKKQALIRAEPQTKHLKPTEPVKTVVQCSIREITPQERFFSYLQLLFSVYNNNVEESRLLKSIINNTNRIDIFIILFQQACFYNDVPFELFEFFIIDDFNNSNGATELIWGCDKIKIFISDTYLLMNVDALKRDIDVIETTDVQFPIFIYKNLRHHRDDLDLRCAMFFIIEADALFEAACAMIYETSTDIVSIKRCCEFTYSKLITEDGRPLEKENAENILGDLQIASNPYLFQS